MEKYKTKFIGHAGCLFGVPNTEEAFLYAAEVLKYQALECDVQVTLDGVYVTNHDSFIKDVVISKTEYKDVKDLVLTYGKYSGHVCTLEKYFDICKKYDMEAIVEIKGSSPGLSDYSQNNVPKLMEYIKSQGMWEKTTILCGVKKVLEAIRTYGYNDIKMQVLVNSFDNQDVYDFCIKNKCDVSTNVTYGGTNSDDWLEKYKNAGCKISVWTFSDTSDKGYQAVQKWIDKGVDYVTCDCHDMSKLERK